MTTKTIKILAKNSENIAYYQVDILNELIGTCFADISIGYENSKLTIFNDVSGMHSLLEIYEKKELTRSEGIKVIKDILHGINYCAEHLLNPKCILLFPDKIFLSPDNCFKFIYAPLIAKEENPSKIILPESFIDFVLLSGKGKAFSTDEVIMLKNLNFKDLKQVEETIRYLEDSVINKKSSFIASNLKNKIKPFPSSFGGIVFVCIFLIIVQGLLLLLAFLSLRNYENFKHHIIPLLIVIFSLLFIALSDLVLFFNKNSPLYKFKTNFRNENSKKNNSNAFINDEKTTFINSNEINKRIAMLCSEIPGTPEESKSHKGYILVDDFLIGRDKIKSDFILENMTVGRTHARILRKANSFFIEDLGSKNGTYLNEQRLKKNIEILLPDKCKISFADMHYYFVVS